MKKTAIAIVVLLAASVSAGLLVYEHSVKPKALQKAPPVVVKTLPIPIKQTPVAAPQPVVESGYVIGVVAISKSVNGELISLKIYNDGDTTLTSDPDTQFKLVGVDDHVSRSPIPRTTSSSLIGQLPTNTSRSGIIKFDSFVNEASQLRFYPDSAQPNFIVVPLIPLPESQ